MVFFLCDLHLRIRPNKAEVQKRTRSIKLKFVGGTYIYCMYSTLYTEISILLKLIPEVWLAELSISDLELENSDRSSENSDLLSL